MGKEIIKTQNAPAAIGPYSQAVKVNGLLFVSGQIPIQPTTGQVISDEIREQTKQVMENLQAILNEAGYNISDIVKTTIYIKDMNDFSTINEVYGAYFTEYKPARATVEVSRLPKDVKVEIECIASK